MEMPKGKPFGAEVDAGDPCAVHRGPRFPHWWMLALRYKATARLRSIGLSGFLGCLVG